MFWSWQSDTPGKTGRHFVRDALHAAVEDLKSTADLDEPVRESIHLDHDRKDVPGSPDLAATIFAKIDASTVVVVDVTPVGQGSTRSGESGDAAPIRKIMNPNAAIELGYALGKHGSEKLLMICNEHYGGRQDLPFDLAHKAGPIFYRLPPDAARAQIVSAQLQLQRTLKEALRPLLNHAPLPIASPPDLTSSGTNTGVFYKVDESLGQHGDARFGQGVQDYFCATSPILYLKILPTVPNGRRLVRSEVSSTARSMPFFSRTMGSVIVDNRWGSACVEPIGNTNEVQSVAQLTLKGELWGVNSNLLHTFSEDLLVIGAVEALLQRRLPEYARLLHTELAVSLPMIIEAGFQGVQGRKVLLDRFTTAGTIFKEEPEPARAVLTGLDTFQITDALLTLFEGLFLSLIDERRPDNYRRFPHHDKHADYSDW